ncbi:MAG: alcohol dehydrogenase catalytic domain-containing protein [Herbaspirillum sp.]
MLIATSDRGVVISEEPLPKCRETEVLIKTKFTMVSPGTERHYIEMIQNHHGADLALGYCAVGEVVAVGADISEFLIGDAVIAMGWKMAVHSDYIVMPRRLVCRYRDQPAHHALLATIGATAAHSIDRARLHKSDQILVVGVGLLGSMIALGASRVGCSVWAHDVNSEQLNHLVWGNPINRPDFLDAVDRKFHCIFLCFDATDGINLDKWARLLDMNGGERSRSRVVNAGRCHGTVSLIPDSGNVDFINVSRCGSGYRNDAYHHGLIEISAPSYESTVTENLRRSLEWLSVEGHNVSRLPYRVITQSEALKFYNSPDFFEPGINLISYSQDINSNGNRS